MLAQRFFRQEKERRQRQQRDELERRQKSMVDHKKIERPSLLKFRSSKIFVEGGDFIMRKSGISLAKERKKQLRPEPLHMHTVQRELSLGGPHDDHTEIGKQGLTEKLQNLESIWSVMASAKPAYQENEFSDSGDMYDLDEEETELPEGTHYMLHPQAPHKVKWDILIAALIIYSTLSVPLRIGFDLSPSKGEAVLDIIVDILFGIDIVASFRTAFFDEDGEIVIRPRAVARHYLRGWFAIDFLSTAPIDRVVVRLSRGSESAIFRSTKLLRVMRLARLLKLARIFKLGKILGQQEESNSFSPSIFSLIKMLLYMGYIGHILGCMFHWLTTFGDSEDMNWLTYYGIQDESVALRYCASLYWAFTTMTTVGYGDVIVTNNAERLFCLLGMLVGATVFGYIVGNVSFMMESLDVQSALHTTKMDRIKEYIMSRSFPEKFSSRVLLHYKYFYKHVGIFDSESILCNLPVTSVTTLSFAQHEEIVGKLTFLRESPPLFVVQLVPHMNPCMAKGGDVIFYQNEVAADLYFLSSGNISYYLEYERCDSEEGEGVYKKEMSAVGMVFQDHCLGEAGVMLAKNHPCSAIAMSNSDLCSIPKVELLDTLSGWPIQHAKLIKEGKTLMKRLHTFTARKKGRLCELDGAMSAEQKSHRQSLQTIHERMDAGAQSVTTANDELGQIEMLAVVAAAAAAGADAPPPEESWSGRPQSFIAGPTGRVSMAPKKDRPSVALKAETLKRMASYSSKTRPSSPNSQDKKYKEYHAGGGDEKLNRMASAQQMALNEISPQALFLQLKIIHPDSLPKAFWDIFIALLIVWSVVEVTFRLAFDASAEGGWVVWQWIIDIFFGCDMLLSFTTAYWDANNNLFVRRKEICNTYLRSWFAVDFMSTFPLDMVMAKALSGGGGLFRSTKLLRTVRLIRLFKIFRLLKMSAFFERYEDSMPVNPAVIRLVKLLVLMSFSAHLNACIWYYVGTQNGDHSWVYKYCLSDNMGNNSCLSDLGSWPRYLSSVYWAFTTMTTVGYGDITPAANKSELVVAIISEVAGTTLFAYVIGALVTIVLNLDPKERLRKQQVEYLNEFMRDMNLTGDQKSSIRRHFKFKLEYSSVFPENEILSNLPPFLRIPATLFVHRHSLPHLPLLCGIEELQPGFMALILPRLHPGEYGKGDIVLSPNLVPREMYFMLHGVCESIRVAAEGSYSTFFRPGGHFGAGNILLDSNMGLSLKVKVKARTRCELLILSKQDLDFICHYYPLAGEELRQDLGDWEEILEWVELPPTVEAEIRSALEAANQMLGDQMPAGVHDGELEPHIEESTMASWTEADNGMPSQGGGEDGHSASRVAASASGYSALQEPNGERTQVTQVTPPMSPPCNVSLV